MIEWNSNIDIDWHVPNVVILFTATIALSESGSPRSSGQSEPTHAVTAAGVEYSLYTTVVIAVNG